MRDVKKELELLNKAISMGVLVVKHDDKETRYRSLPEMLIIKRKLEAELSGEQGSKSIKFEYKASY